VSFREKYQVVGPLGEGECQPFRALQIPTGRPVLVHHLPTQNASSDHPDLESLIFGLLRGASAAQRGRFLDMGDDEGHTYVVTADVPECLDLRKWLESLAGTQPENQTDPELPAGLSGPESLDSTRSFTAAALRPASGSQARVAVPPSEAPRPAAREQGLGATTPPSDFPRASYGSANRGSANFSGFWESSSAVIPAGPPESVPTPPASSMGADASYGVPESTATFLRAPFAATGPSESDVAVSPLGEADQARVPAVTPPPVSRKAVNALEKPKPGATLASRRPRGQIPAGFEVVYRSNKSRTPSSPSSALDKPPIEAPSLPVEPPAAASTAGTIGGGHETAYPDASGERRQGGEANSRTAWLDSPRLGQSATHAPPAEHPSPAAPSILAPRPASSEPMQTDEYNRLFENLAPAKTMDPGEIPLSPRQPGAEANDLLQTDVTLQGSLPGDAVSQPLAAQGTPRAPQIAVSSSPGPHARSAGKKGRIWVPVLILSSLFLMTVALLLYFLLK
jgi:hypothetical protein